MKVLVPLGARSQVLRDRLEPTDVLLLRIDKEKSGTFTIRLFNVDDRDVQFGIGTFERKPNQPEECHLELDLLYRPHERSVRVRSGSGAAFPSTPLFNLEEIEFPPATRLAAGAPSPFSFEISRLPFEGAGVVPDGSRVPGSPLLIEKSTEGKLVLTWDPSCRNSDTDYEIYEGSVGVAGSHAPLHCTTEGNTTVTFAPGSGNLYYLVVPRNGRREGSYGTRSDGTEIAPAASPCLLQKSEPCPRN